MVGEVPLEEVPELRGFGSKFRVFEVSGYALDPPAEFVDVSQVNGSDGIGGLLRAASFGSPTAEELSETPATGLLISGGGAHGIDESADDAATEYPRKKPYPLWVHVLIGAVGGVGGASLMEWLRGRCSARSLPRRCRKPGPGFRG